MKIIGIDLGLTGAMVLYDTIKRSVEATLPMPTVSVQNKRSKNKKTGKMGWSYKKKYDPLKISKWLISCPAGSIAAMEPIVPFPMGGGENRLGFGRMAEGFGGFDFLLKSLGIRYGLCHPRVWKKYFRITKDFIDFEDRLFERDGMRYEGAMLKRKLGEYKKSLSLDLVLKTIVDKKLFIQDRALTEIDHNMADAMLIAMYQAAIEEINNGE